MDSSWNIAGHKKQIEFLSNSIRSGKLAHAYLFAGPESVGKRTVAERFIQILLCQNSNACNQCGQCRTFIQKANADYISVSDPAKIKIEEVRELIYKLSLKPYMARYKAAIIDGAESMTTEAGNALLKSLEEPKPYTVIILVSSAPNKLPRTILSRVQKINFGLVDQSEYRHLISDVSEEKQKLIAEYSGGRPGLAVNIQRDDEFAQQLSELEVSYEIFRNSGISERLQLALRIADLETVQIAQHLEFFMNRLNSELLANAEKKTAGILSRTSQARQYIAQNANSKLLLFDLMLKTQ